VIGLGLAFEARRRMQRCRYVPFGLRPSAHLQREPRFAVNTAKIQQIATAARSVWEKFT
jgi:hypothetical protein